MGTSIGSKPKRVTTLMNIVLGLKQTRVTGVEINHYGLVIDVRPTVRLPRCSGCYYQTSKVHDRRTRNWRHRDLAGMYVQLRYSMRRVRCPHCGVRTELVPWAEPSVWFTRDFEDEVAYMAQRTDKTTISDSMRVSWVTVGEIVERVVRRERAPDALDNLTIIGVDELSYRKHHEYVTVVVDHTRSAVVWVGEGKSAATLNQFFKELGAERAAKLEAVTIDMSGAYIKAVTEASPQAQIIFDRFHVQRLAHDALDEVRRAEVRQVKGTPESGTIKGTRWTLHKSPWNLTRTEEETLDMLQRRNRRLYRAYLLKESLCDILDHAEPFEADTRLDTWLRWARRSRLEPFKRVAATLREHRAGIVAYMKTRHNSGRIEGLNGKIRAITRRSYGFHRVESLIAMIFLCCSGIVMLAGHVYPT
jgi:transposase